MHQIGMRTTSSIKRNRQQFNSTIYSPWLDVQKRKLSLFFLNILEKSCIFEMRVHWKIEKKLKSCGKNTNNLVIGMSLIWQPEKKLKFLWKKHRDFGYMDVWKTREHWKIKIFWNNLKKFFDFRKKVVYLIC